MPVRTRKPNDVAQQSVPLLLLAVGLVTTNNSVTFVDDEASILSAAATPVRTILAHFFSSGGHDPAPLFTIVLHLWLRSTGANFDYFRIPSILFFMGGLFLLARAYRYVAGKTGGSAVLWLGVLWPFGFHFVRLAAGYSFPFFLVAGLTLAYFKYLEEQSFGRGAVLFLFGAALLWTNYFGWAVLACLAIDQVLRARRKEPVAELKGLAAIAALLLVSFIPLFAAARSQVSDALHAHRGPLAILVGAAFRVFSLFVSEALAPWYWWLSIPAALAILLCVTLVVWFAPKGARRFLYFSAGSLLVLAVAGVLETGDLLMLAPWVLLPAGAAIEATKPRWATFALATALLLVAGAGWYGIYARRYYAAPRFIEPWQEVAADAASKISNGTTMISDRPPLLLYLTYFLRVPAHNGPWQFEGTLPDEVKHPQVYSPAAWLASGHSPAGKIMLVRRGADTAGNAPIDQVAHQLDQSCGSISSRLRMRDDGYRWKQRLFPELHEPQWRIEIREYDCDSSNSKQIYRIPSP